MTTSERAASVSLAEPILSQICRPDADRTL